jgi:hypothetical protein
MGSQNLSSVKAESKPVLFSPHNSWLSGSFDSSMSISDSNISPNGNATLVCSVKANDFTVDLKVADLGNASVQVHAIGKANYSIPSLSYSKPGVGKMDVFLILDGSINGQLNADSNGTLNKTNLEWRNPAVPDQNVILQSSNAKEGSLINVTISKITYIISAEVVAVANAKNSSSEKTYVSLTEIGKFVGNPSSVTGSVTVVNPGSSNAFLLGIAGALGIACVLVTFMFFRAKRELSNLKKSKVVSIPLGSVNPKQPPVTVTPAQAPAPSAAQTVNVATPANVCKNCGSGNTPAAKFCKKCGKKL